MAASAICWFKMVVVKSHVQLQCIHTDFHVIMTYFIQFHKYKVAVAIAWPM